MVTVLKNSVFLIQLISVSELKINIDSIRCGHSHNAVQNIDGWAKESLQ